MGRGASGVDDDDKDDDEDDDNDDDGDCDYDHNIVMIVIIVDPNSERSTSVHIPQNLSYDRGCIKSRKPNELPAVCPPWDRNLSSCARKTQAFMAPKIGGFMLCLLTKCSKIGISCVWHIEAVP